MGQPGSLFQLVAVLSGAASVFFYCAAVKTGDKRYYRYGTVQKAVQLISLFASAAVLAYAVFYNDFGLLYVSSYSDRTLPPFYKVSVLWAALPGSFICAALVAAVCSLADSFRMAGADLKYSSCASLVSTLFVTLFLCAAFFYPSAFSELDFIPVNGAGLSPSLQSVPVALFMPVIFLAFAAAVKIFSHACAALLTKDFSSYWIRISCPWAYFLIVSCVTVIFMAGYDFYYGAGEILWRRGVALSFLIAAFLMTSGFVHSSEMYFSKGRMKAVTLSFVFFSFLAVMAAFYTASCETASLSSKPFEAGTYVFIFALFFFLAFSALIFRARKNLAAVSCRSPARPRELAFRWLSISFAVVSACVCAAASAGCGSFSVWSRGVYFYYAAALIPSILFAVVLISFVRLFRTDGRVVRDGLQTRWTALWLSAFTVLAAVWLRSPQTAVSWSCVAVCAVILAVWNNRKYYGAGGSGAVHAGLALICIAAVCSFVFYQEVRVSVFPGDAFSFENYDFEIKSVGSVQKNNYVSTFVNISLSSDKNMLGNIDPEIRGYNNSAKLTAVTKSIPAGFSLISAAFVSYDFSSRETGIVIMYYPFALLAWPGLVIFILGVLKITGRSRYVNG